MNNKLLNIALKIIITTVMYLTFWKKVKDVVDWVHSVYVSYLINFNIFN